MACLPSLRVLAIYKTSDALQSPLQLSFLVIETHRPVRMGHSIPELMNIEITK
jgi:hypothetical protein